jgi:hypothetical protein
MTESEITDGNERACELVGRFLYYFSKLEAELNSAIMTLFKLDADSSDIVTANIDFFRKLSIIGSAVRAQNASRDQEWLRNEIDETFSAIAKINDLRIIIAHSAFSAHPVDGVQFTRIVARDKLNRHAPIWTENNFAREFEKMKHLELALGNVLRHIQPYTPKLDFSDPRNSFYIPLLT